MEICIVKTPPHPLPLQVLDLVGSFVSALIPQMMVFIYGVKYYGV